MQLINMGGRRRIDTDCIEKGQPGLRATINQQIISLF